MFVRVMAHTVTMRVRFPFNLKMQLLLWLKITNVMAHGRYQMFSLCFPMCGFCGHDNDYDLL